jgi:NAD(P)H-hydrate epimerase
MSSFIQDIHTDFLKIDTAQMIEVDRLMIEEYHIDLIQMMENAGRCLALLTKERFFQGDVEGKTIIVLVGTGGNGGGAMVAARRLHNWGAKVQVFTTAEEEHFAPIPLQQYQILKRMGIPVQLAGSIAEVPYADAILDGIIGYSLKGNPHGFAGSMIFWANSKAIPIIALDTPSGLDLTTGKLLNPVIKATATLTLAMPKKGLFNEESKPVVGELYVGDIGVPMQLYKEKTLLLKPSNIFRYADIVRIF